MHVVDAHIEGGEDFGTGQLGGYRAGRNHIHQGGDGAAVDGLGVVAANEVGLPIETEHRAAGADAFVAQADGAGMGKVEEVLAENAVEVGIGRHGGFDLERYIFR